MSVPPPKFSESHIYEDCRELEGFHENGLFFGCKFDKLSGVTLKDCDLSESEFETTSIKDALGFTLTLDCHSFRKTRWSPLLFDLLLCLAASTVGNDDKREQLKQVVGLKRYESICKLLRTVE